MDCQKIWPGNRRVRGALKKRALLLDYESPSRVWHFALQKANQPGIKAHEAVAATIARKHAPQCRRPGRKIPVDLQLEQQGGSCINEIKDVFKPRNWMASDTQTPNIFPRGLADPEWALAEARCIGIVKDDEVTIDREPEVTLDSSPECDRRTEGSKRIFGRLGSRMEASVGKARRPRIERVSA